MNIANTSAQLRFSGPVLADIFLGKTLNGSFDGDGDDVDALVEVLQSDGNAFSPAIEIVPAVPFYDYQAKYKRDDTEYVIPARLDPAIIEECEGLALAAHRALGCSGHSRVDLNRAGTPLLDIRPDLASYSRGAHLLFLTGDTRKARNPRRRARRFATACAPCWLHR